MQWHLDGRNFSSAKISYAIHVENLNDFFTIWDFIYVNNNTIIGPVVCTKQGRGASVLERMESDIFSW